MQYHFRVNNWVGRSSKAQIEFDNEISCRLQDISNGSQQTAQNEKNGTLHSFSTRYIGYTTNTTTILSYLLISISLGAASIECSPSKDHQTSSSDANLDTYCEVIQPLMFDELDTTKLEPLLVKNCPDTIEIFIQSSWGDEDFVINLVKNKRLISDKYFEIKNANTANIKQSNHHKNTDNRTADYTEDHAFHNNHQFISLHNFTSNDDHCHYHGLVNENPNSTSAISIVDSHLLSGFFHNDKQNSYLLEADMSLDVTILHQINATSQLSLNPPSSCLHLTSFKDNTDTASERRSAHKRFRRGVLSFGQQSDSPKQKRFLKSNPDNKVLHEPFMSNSSSLYVELLIVHDHSQFKENQGQASLIAERTMQIVNIMNAFYRQLNIFVSLVGVIYWVKEDEIELTEDGDATLTNFLKYRYEKLLPRYKHDNAQLITSTSFNGSVVGKALKGPICTHDHSGGVNTDHSHNPVIVAVTLAHELGHNLGMEHDEDDKCKCPDEKCIMSSSSSLVHPKHWSSCSIDYLEESRKHGLLDCLINEPTQIFGPVCGNGFVEEGEDCDLGEPIPSYGTSKSRSGNNRNSIRSSPESGLAISNPCCDRATCKFTPNATCAQGSCCDLTRCSVYNLTETKVCRSRKTDCDLEELCDGLSEYCPPDVHYHDGIECGPTINLADGSLPVAGTELYNKSRAYCFNGRCASHESQCQLLWGAAATTSQTICYEQNVHGNTSGNCGYDRLEKKYAGCEPDNAICGMLHCAHDSSGSGGDPTRKSVKLAYGFESASILTLSYFTMSHHARIICRGAIIDAGPGLRDPGLVPNGAACGDEHMCYNEKCVHVQEVLHTNWCPSDCNGNGICDNMGVCHCNDGTIGTSCYQFFGSNFHLSLILYIIMFFGPLIAILFLAFKHYQSQIKMWWFLHNRKIFVRNKAREPTQQRRTAYNANGHRVSISEPIPLNQQSGTNKPFFDPLADPWAETNNHQTKSGESLGYRLEPIRKEQQVPPKPPLPDYNQDNRMVAQQSHQTDTSSNQLKPVRSAPPPPVPPHRSKHNANM